MGPQYDSVEPFRPASLLPAPAPISVRLSVPSATRAIEGEGNGREAGVEEGLLVPRRRQLGARCSA